MIKNSVPLILASSVAICWGIASYLNVILARRTDALRASFFFQVLGIPLLLIGLFISPYHIPFVNLLSILLIGALIALVLAASMHALRLEKSAIVYPLLECSVLVVFVLGILVWNESFSLLKLISLIVVFLGIILLSLNFHAVKNWRNFSISKGALWALGASIALGVYFFLVAGQARVVGWFYVTLLIRVAATFTLLGLLFLKNRIQISSMFSGLPWSIAIAAATIDVVGFSIYNSIVARYELSYVQIIASSSTVVATILGVLLLKERLSFYQKIGVVLTIAGVMVLQIG